MKQHVTMILNQEQMAEALGKYVSRVCVLGDGVYDISVSAESPIPEEFRVEIKKKGA